MIGVNSQIASEAASVNGSQAGSTGVGFAVSSDTVAQAVKAIEAGKGVSSASTSRRAVQSEGAQAEREGRETEFTVRRCARPADRREAAKPNPGAGETKAPAVRVAPKKASRARAAGEAREGSVVIVP